LILINFHGPGQRALIAGVERAGRVRSAC